MSPTYPKPATPLPWNALQEPDEISGQDGSRAAVADGANSRVADSNAAYLVRAANAFPHLVAALEAAADALDQAEMGIDPDADRRLRQYVIQTEKVVRAALAIARGEATP